MRCTWCDTPYAFYEGKWLTLEEVLQAVREFGCPLVEITGGEPLLQPSVLPLMSALCDEGYQVLLETGGGLDIQRVDPRVHRIVDVKCPQSGESENNHWSNLDFLTERDELKFVLADQTDYEWAREVVLERSLVERCPVIFSSAHDQLSPREVAEWVLRDRLDVRVQVQLHKLLWGAEATGV